MIKDPQSVVPGRTTRSGPPDPDWEALALEQRIAWWKEQLNVVVRGTGRRHPIRRAGSVQTELPNG